MQCESGFFGKVEVLDRFLLPEDIFYTPQKGTRQKKKKKRKKKKMKELQSFDSVIIIFISISIVIIILWPPRHQNSSS